MKRIVVKLGGSQLTSPDFPKRLLDWVGAVGHHAFYLIVGGGEVVEAMRELDRIHACDEVAMHWRCVELLKASSDVVEELLKRLNPNITLHRIQTPQQFETAALQTSSVASIHLVDCIAFYQPALVFNSEAEYSINPPRVGWRTTTDALAIYCAALLNADQCILLKSCSIDPGISIAKAAQLGIVDPESVAMAEQYSNVTLLQL